MTEINRNRKNSDLSKMELLEAVSIPIARSGHKIVLFNNCIYSIGGYNSVLIDHPNDENTNYPIIKELNQCNLVTREWKTLQTKGEMPSELASHAANLCGNLLLVFGGTGMPFGEKLSNQLHILNLDTLIWNSPECGGDVPNPIYGCSFTRHGNMVYVFGGTTGWDYNNLLYALNLTTMIWQLINPINPRNRGVPYSRYRHEIIYHEQQLFLFGGGKATVSYDFSKIQVFDLDMLKWSTYDAKNDADHGFPRARRCHSCIKFGDFVFMLGGYNGEDSFEDIWKICLHSLQWTRLSTNLPEPLFFHSADITKEGHLIVYGGVGKDGERNSQIYSFWLQVPDLKTQCWQNIYNSTNKHLTSMNNEQHMLEIGIPKDLVEQIKN